MAALTYGDVRKWKAELLGTAADRVKKDADALEEVRYKIKSEIVPSSWLGTRSEEAADLRDKVVTLMNKHLDGKRQVERALLRAVCQVEEVERLVKEVEDLAWSEGLGIRDDGRVTGQVGQVIAAFSPPLPQWALRWAEDEEEDRSEAAEEIRRIVRKIVSLATAADATVRDSIPEGYVRGVDAYGTPSPEVAAHWAELTDPERQAIIKQLVEELAEENGIETPPILWDLADTDPGSSGEWREYNRTIALNPDRLSDPRVFHYVAHEMRHARQWEAVHDLDAKDEDDFDEHEEDGITREQAKEWKKNFKDYTWHKKDHEKYFKQPVEVDAREAGRQYVEDELTPDELDRLLRRAAGSAPG